MVEYKGIEIDEEAKIILAYVRNHGYEATTDEITDETRLDDNDKIRYRYREKLFPTNLLTGRKISTKKHDEVWQVTLTDKAIKAIDSGRLGSFDDFNIKHDSKEERLNSHDRRLEDLEERADHEEKRLTEQNKHIAGVIEVLSEEGSIEDISKEDLVEAAQEF